MRRQQLKIWSAAILLAAGAATLPFGLASRTIFAEPAETPSDKEPQEMIHGTIEAFHENNHDDVDGLTLKGGVDVQFPPHLGRAITDLASVGDEVRIRAERVTRPKGEVVLEARRIERDGRGVDIDRPPPPPKGKPGPKGKPRNETPMKAEGVVAELATNPHGDVDGLLLEDETEVKFPPHLGAELEALVKPGTKVVIDGRRHVTPKGDVHLHADRIELVGTGTVIERHPPEHPGPRGPGGPGHDRPEEHRIDAGELARTQQEILRELREIRRLLEKDRS